MHLQKVVFQIRRYWSNFTVVTEALTIAAKLSRIIIDVTPANSILFMLSAGQGIITLTEIYKPTNEGVSFSGASGTPDNNNNTEPNQSTA